MKDLDIEIKVIKKKVLNVFLVEIQVDSKSNGYKTNLDRPLLFTISDKVKFQGKKLGELDYYKSDSEDKTERAIADEIGRINESYNKGDTCLLNYPFPEPPDVLIGLINTQGGEAINKKYNNKFGPIRVVTSCQR